MLCLVARYREKVLRFKIPGDAAILGASPSVDLVVPFPGVSRSHARIVLQGGTVQVVDLRSKNGTWQGSDRVTECILRPGETARVGQAVLSIEDGPTSDMDLHLLPREGALPGDDPEDGTDTFRETGRGSPVSRALRFVRLQEKSGSGADHSARKAFLDEAAELLGASALVVLRPGTREDLMIVEFGVEVPPLEGLSEVARLAESRPASFARRLRRGKYWACLCATRADLVVAALFPAHTQSLEPWHVDFFDYVAEMIVPEEPPARGREDRKNPKSASSPTGDPLVFPSGMVVGRSKAMTELLDQIRATAASAMDVLLLGETGTGKELFARMVHDSGPKAKGPFVAINCAAIPSELLEAELFGVEARVATGVDPRMGLFQRANGGAIFLDEVGELAESLQAKLLRVLQEREVLSIGASTPRKVDVQIISASNRNLASAIQAGKFRADLYYRLRGLRFDIPPLRERLDDLPGLVLAFAEKKARVHGKRISGVSRKALDVLRTHQWPGNVRELQNEVERAVLVCPDGGALRCEHFRPIAWAVERRAEQLAQEETGRRPAPAGPIHSLPRKEDMSTVPPDNGGSVPATLRDRVDFVERAAIGEALRVAKGNRSLAARMLGITRNGLAMKLRRLFGEVPGT